MRKYPDGLVWIAGIWIAALLVWALPLDGVFTLASNLWAGCDVRDGVNCHPSASGAFPVIPTPIVGIGFAVFALVFATAFYFIWAIVANANDRAKAQAERRYWASLRPEVATICPYAYRAVKVSNAYPCEVVECETITPIELRAVVNTPLPRWVERPRICAEHLAEEQVQIPTGWWLDQDGYRIRIR